MTYSVKEIFYTLQGEGGQAGRPAVFCRFAGCNLWSGREADRASVWASGGARSMAGWLADQIGVRWTVGLTAAVCIAAALYFERRRSVVADAIRNRAFRMKSGVTGHPNGMSVP